jgi:hypothetical protein
MKYDTAEADFGWRSMKEHCVTSHSDEDHSQRQVKGLPLDNIAPRFYISARQSATKELCKACTTAETCGPPFTPRLHHRSLASEPACPGGHLLTALQRFSGLHTAPPD